MPEERLPYATHPLYFSNGSFVEEFIIPDEDRELVLEQLYPFSTVPKLSDQMIDIHVDKVFTVKDFRVSWKYGMNYLVSPYYPEGGGTVIDWMDPNTKVDGDDWDDNDFFEDDDSAMDGGDENPF